MCRYTTLWNIRHCTQAGDNTGQLRDQHWSNVTVAPKQSGLKSVWLCYLGALQKMVYQRRQFTIINQLKQAIATEWGKLSQRLVDRAIGQLRHRLQCVVLQKGRHTEHWCRNCNMWPLLWTIIEAINRLFSVVNCLQYVVPDIVLFSRLLLRHWYFTR